VSPKNLKTHYSFILYGKGQTDYSKHLVNSSPSFTSDLIANLIIFGLQDFL